MHLVLSMTNKELLALYLKNQINCYYGTEAGQILTTFPDLSSMTELDRALTTINTPKQHFHEMLAGDVEIHLSPLLAHFLHEVPEGTHPEKGYLLLWNIVRNTILIPQDCEATEQLQRLRKVQLFYRHLDDHKERWTTWARNSGEVFFQQLTLQWLDTQP